MSRRNNHSTTPNSGPAGSKVKRTTGAGKKHNSGVSDCTRSCSLEAHALKVATFVASGKSIDVLRRKLPLLCSNAFQNLTETGHSVLHIAAQYGYYDIIKELKEELTSQDLNRADRESRYTALHLAIYYGQLHCAVLLRQLGADLFLRDYDGYPAHRLASLDRVEHEVKRHCEFFAQPQDGFPQLAPLTWGTNVNNLLGHADVKPRAQPDFLPLLVGCKRSVGCTDRHVQPKAALSKFHMILVTSRGEVFTCGHGRGGRLGHGGEESELKPRIVEFLLKSAVHLVAAGQNHSVFVDVDNNLYTCGNNENGQLGQACTQQSGKQVANSLSPRKVWLKEERPIIGVAASRYHTAVITASKLYVFGTDRGQLGRAESHNTRVATPFCVPLNYQNGSEFSISEVAASNDVTACLCRASIWLDEHGYTTSYFVFVCMNHTVHLVTCLTSGLCQLNLWTRLSASSAACAATGPAKKSEVKARAKETVVMCLSQRNELLSWSCGDSSFRKCNFKNGPPPGRIEKLVVTCKLAIVTSLGEIFTAAPEKQHAPALTYNRKPSVSFDSMGSFGQLVHDQEEMIATSHFKPFSIKRVPVADQVWMVAMDPKAENFVALTKLPRMEVVRPLSERTAAVQECIERSGMQDTLHDIAFMTKDPTQQVYSCKYFLVSHNASVLSRLESCGAATTDDDGFVTVSATKKFPADVVRQLLSALCSSWQSSKATDLSIEQEEECTVQGELVTESVSRCYHALFGTSMPRTGTFSWAYSKCADLSDVVLCAQDGVLFHAHKCVLALRSPDYFGHMLLGGWQESSQGARPISIHADSHALNILLDYLYEDDMHVQADWTCEMLCALLFAADLLLLDNFKSQCEFHLVTRMTHRNVADLLEISSLLGADQLFNACCDFVYFYFPMLLETRVLESLPSEILKTLPARYLQRLPENRSLPVIDQRTVDDLFSRTPAADQAEGAVDDNIDYVVKGSGPRRRQLSLSYNANKSSADMELDELIAEMHMSDSAVESDFGEEGDNEEDSDRSSPEGIVSPSSERIDRPGSQSTPISTPNKRKILSNFQDSAIHCSPSEALTPGLWMSSGGSSCPSSASSLSLSQIMQQEEEALHSRRRPAASPAPNQRPSNPSQPPSGSSPMDVNPAVVWNVGPKATQSQRKQKKNRQSSSMPVPQSAPVNPWAGSAVAQATSPAASAPSFRDILHQEERAVTVVPGTPVSRRPQATPRKSKTSWKRQLSWGEVDPSQNGVDIPGQEIPVVNAWGVSPSPVTPTPLSTSPASFKAIVQSQEQALNPVNCPGKPLSVIQLEEKAIDELMAHYKKRNEPITVTRVTSKPSAPPRWKQV
eukprot:scpid13532/ scgid2313/ Inhibitor of Bruton tyrosine kinase